MSTESSEDQSFEETLKNFQMLTSLSLDPMRSKAAPSACNNPFQIASDEFDKFKTNEAVVTQIFGKHCECGADRLATPNSKQGSTNLEHSIINPTAFKHKAKGEKKVIVRESTLKNIGKCVHQNLAKNNNAKETIKQKQSTASTLLPTQAGLRPSLSENNLAKCFINDANDDILDFRLLVAQCSEMTLSTSCSKMADSVHYTQNSFKSLRQPEFSGSPSARPNAKHFRRNRRAQQLKRYNSTSSLESDSSSNSSGVPFCGLLGNCPGPSNTSPSAASSQQQQQQTPQSNQQQHQSPSSSSPTSSASCSTQARLNSSMPCDITIDEMASYFETLVHIPKKMSSMAEMMYI
ncbi:uncharacterized protein LOC129769560 [Toxorhynchites rutilus septentrionalis]|uniref:uncharacterized protein LOC129769560 n=1 Tax=Toxorhynchites rutilus septentrionalis TaxID=329112 RepID=UPI00247AFCAE|nr:uncharacterized protein LOC129769560 [Toxorhynchites rutilus septentrionalis]XP_055627883.1 uncharacterized protein LOC129769560 [Toxorhynchites rutilus septentrionalis]XP_055627884.1 uncharacterized protein LOC129769560 [Toxorhynchites rutilus septentrionalis]XP_055627885.1 uncharacterized protein LOC129769560 [Toxorhynchites rutilus septentrionalis]XP_055627886.1 uncharacterized protein LOC129769560 [Toxorhynchites rutilus septentrionalis]